MHDSPYARRIRIPRPTPLLPRCRCVLPPGAGIPPRAEQRRNGGTTCRGATSAVLHSGGWSSGIGGTIVPHVPQWRNPSRLRQRALLGVWLEVNDVTVRVISFPSQSLCVPLVSFFLVFFLGGCFFCGSRGRPGPPRCRVGCPAGARIRGGRNRGRPWGHRRALPNPQRMSSRRRTGGRLARQGKGGRCRPDHSPTVGSRLCFDALFFGGSTPKNDSVLIEFYVFLLKSIKMTDSASLPPLRLRVTRFFAWLARTFGGPRVSGRWQAPG